MRRADNLTIFMCRLSWKLGDPSLLEPSWPVQTFNGIALPLPKTSRRGLGPTVPPVQWMSRVLVPGVKRQKVHCSSFCLVRNITHFIIQYWESSPVCRTGILTLKFYNFISLIKVRSCSIVSLCDPEVQSNSLGVLRHFNHYEVSASSFIRNVMCCLMDSCSERVLGKQEHIPVKLQ
jgi:hypothetical protein